jgi:hypothetical protein
VKIPQYHFRMSLFLISSIIHNSSPRRWVHTMWNILESIKRWLLLSIHWIGPCHLNEDLSFYLARFSVSW